MEQTTPATIEEYIANCPAEVQPQLYGLRRTIVQAAPQATEKISWGMVTFALHGNLVHFSAEKKHIGFRPAPSSPPPGESACVRCWTSCTGGMPTWGRHTRPQSRRRINCDL